MAPSAPLPLPPEFKDADSYVESLLQFSTSCELFQTLCGGVHILDFFTREPSLYSTVLPESWRSWLEERDIHDILDFLMHEDLQKFAPLYKEAEQPWQTKEKAIPWRGGPLPPSSLVEYAKNIRKHCLAREFKPRPSRHCGPPNGAKQPPMPRSIAIGMKPKKIHEVENFARYVDNLMDEIKEGGGRELTHLVDFGSGQNYLGRALASQPYNRHIIAIESKQLNIDGARDYDRVAKIVKKEKIMRDKKQFRKEKAARKFQEKGPQSKEEPELEVSDAQIESAANSAQSQDSISASEPASLPPIKDDGFGMPIRVYNPKKVSEEGQGTIQYVEHMIQDGNLSPVLRKIEEEEQNQRPEASDATSQVSAAPKNLMVISLHSCGNLLHHGIRSLLLNPTVSAVALIGCCYNLVTERLGPPTYKLPTLRAAHPRLEKTSTAFDPHGFPMSDRLATYPLPGHEDGEAESSTGIRFNITARMMAVQAPQNWTKEESESFFTRHFFRALLQRIFLDRGIINPAAQSQNTASELGSGAGAGTPGGTEPIIIGSLRKACYTSFTAYVRGAVSKIAQQDSTSRSTLICDSIAAMTDAEIEDYETRYYHRRKELSVIWSLMAFSAGVVEAVIVVDRWLFLKEQPNIQLAWVESVFDYMLSPRNLVVVGVKREEDNLV
ncbi:hypothetical protein L228DRAFT_262831 [Xylona heveae TC161]|uniref:Methyltransferase domain-containing protein n=1 Tax=Xylona heveae (strain CBS 132557 / TC161) TaxID=1328760 RepID=A0A165A9Q4_XYLHT|nr:hypothetical protein L228DRAFT_262831 [Xylona heveae TC161]KZF20139.1 hypothetical protein L228DRAFT_262831 [Xylona heveae TC161]